MRYPAIFLFFILLFSPLMPVFGADPALEEIKPAFRTTGFPIPRFVSLGSDKIYVRAGPGPQYPIKWVYHQNGLPVEVVLEYETWRKVKDMDGEEGWVHQSLLSGKRTILIKGTANVPVRAKPEPEARLIAYMEPNVLGLLEQCRPSWCEISSGGYAGWIERTSLWGLYPDENP